ncbi:MAG: FHA domain-containing protein [Chloroflexi bacterium]|nr:FHA domain-containing protein [Chloroflexota bacterium]
MTADPGVREPGYHVRIREPDSVERVAVPFVTPFVIGREQGCDLLIADLQVSRRHAQLEIQPDGRVVLRDLNSANGTFIGAQRIRDGEWLPLPGSFRIGRTTITVERQP